MSRRGEEGQKEHNSYAEGGRGADGAVLLLTHMDRLSVSLSFSALYPFGGPIHLIY